MAKNVSVKTFASFRHGMVHTQSFSLPTPNARRENVISRCQVRADSGVRVLDCRFVTVAVKCIDRIDQRKKPGMLISLRLKPNSSLLSELKVLEIRFLEDEGAFPSSF